VPTTEQHYMQEDSLQRHISYQRKLSRGTQHWQFLAIAELQCELVMGQLRPLRVFAVAQCQQA
jgi:hypothetical protein